MLDTPVLERQAHAAATVERHAHILWIDHGRGGHGYLRGDSRAFSPIPIASADTSDSDPSGTTPSELLAAAQCSSFVMTLTDLLAQRGTPALELAVDATCQIEDRDCGRTISALHVRVRGRGAELESESFADSAYLALACCPISHALSATAAITNGRRTRPGKLMQPTDLAATAHTIAQRGSSLAAGGASERGCWSR